MKANKCGERIRIARMMRTPPYMQEELAAKMQLRKFNISRNTMSRIEIGARYVTDLELLAFAEILGVSVNWLLEQTDVWSVK